MTRRSFLDVIFSGSILLTLVTFIGAALKFLLPPESSALGGKRVLVGELDQIPVGGSVRRVLAGQGVLIVRTRTGFAGLSLNCTHKGCNVEWDEEKKVVLCPCHGGVFDLQGNVLSGPPPRPLKRYRIKILDNKVYVEG
jgi:cytochrome b6-f complex iron-sulfur subunit